jgi:Zn-finger nucleic acid-binding protein
MDCPDCGVKLEKKLYRGIEVDHCPGCSGMWLDLDELDELEDEAFDVDDLKGTLIHSSTPTEQRCPHCGCKLRSFQYRLKDLELEYCENGHGYWLDEGEEKRVMKLMQQRANDVVRKYTAEAEWDKTLHRLRSPSFFDKLTTLLK